MVDCLAVTLGSIVMDGTTVDGDGITWQWRDLPGWWEGSAPRADVYGRVAADGSAFGRGYRPGRAVDIIGTAYALAAADPVSVLLTARHKLVAAVDLNTDTELAVEEGTLGTLRAAVRQSALAPRFPPNPSERMMMFELPVVSADWRKTDDTVTQTTVGGGGTVTNNGTEPATPSLRIAGDSAANVGVTNTTTGQTISTDLNLTGGDVLVIDCATATALLNGSDATAHLLLGSEFFDLAAGANTVNLVNGGSASLRVDFRHSYR